MLALYTVILNAHYVILNVVKNLSESTDVRLLCYPVDPSLSLRMTKYSEEIATSGNALLAMTYTHKRTQRCHSERSEESQGL